MNWDSCRLVSIEFGGHLVGYQKVLGFFWLVISEFGDKSLGGNELG